MFYIDSDVCASENNVKFSLTTGHDEQETGNRNMTKMNFSLHVLILYTRALDFLKNNNKRCFF